MRQRSPRRRILQGYKTMILAMEEQRFAKPQARIEAMEKAGSADF
jgi:hypothetical protein